MKKVTVKNKKVVKMTTPATKGPSKFLVGALIFSLVLLGVVMVAAKNSQDNRSSAAKKQQDCKAPKVSTYNANKKTWDCALPNKTNAAVDCKNGSVNGPNGKICIQKCEKNHQFRQMPGTGEFGCVPLPVCKSNQKWDETTNTCKLVCKGKEKMVTINGEYACRIPCDVAGGQATEYLPNGEFRCVTVSCPAGYHVNVKRDGCAVNNTKDGKKEIQCSGNTRPVINKTGTVKCTPIAKSGSCPKEGNEIPCASGNGYVGSQSCDGGVWTACIAN